MSDRENVEVPVFELISESVRHDGVDAAENDAVVTRERPGLTLRVVSGGYSVIAVMNYNLISENSILHLPPRRVVTDGFGGRG